MLERGLTLKIRQGFDDKTIVVTELSDQRGASEAQLLYRETQQSIEAREKLSLSVKRSIVPYQNHSPQQKTAPANPPLFTQRVITISSVY